MASGAIIGGYHHSPLDCSLSIEFISSSSRVQLGGSNVWRGETLLPPVKNRRRAHADAWVMKVAANCGLHRDGPGRARMEGFVFNADFRGPLRRIEMPILIGHDLLSDRIDFTNC